MASHLHNSFISLFSPENLLFFLSWWEDKWRKIAPKWCVVSPWQLPCYLCISLLLLRRGLRQKEGLKRFPSAVDSDFQAIWRAVAGAVLLTLWLSVGLGRQRLTCVSRSWPTTHFLLGTHSDSRVTFIWYPWISATWKCQVSGIRSLSFDTLVSVMTPLCPYWPSVHLDLPHTHTYTNLLKLLSNLPL